MSGVNTVTGNKFASNGVSATVTASLLQKIKKTARKTAEKTVWKTVVNPPEYNAACSNVDKCKGAGWDRSDH